MKNSHVVYCTYDRQFAIIGASPLKKGHDANGLNDLTAKWNNMIVELFKFSEIEIAR